MNKFLFYLKFDTNNFLQALSSTVKRDYTAPEYKYHDDPFLIPTSNLNKRMFALSQESGRKAARWIRQEHADLFQHKVADPQIQVGKNVVDVKFGPPPQR